MNFFSPNSTETYIVGRLSRSEEPNVDTWEWFEFAPHVERELLPQEDSEDMFELCIIVCVSFRTVPLGVHAN